jgi:DNA-binding beta-propeller fold protein YncE
MTYAVGGKPAALASDGANLWVTDYGNGYIFKLDTQAGKILGTYGVNPGPGPGGQ